MNLRDIITNQRAALSALEEEAARLEHSDAALENAALKKELAQLSARYAEATAKEEAASAKNTALQTALYEQLYNEKLRIVSNTMRKSDAYFRSGVQGEMNRLDSLRNDLQRQFDDMRRRFTQNDIAVSEEIRAKSDEFFAWADAKLADARMQMAREANAFDMESRVKYEAVRDEPLTEEMVQNAARKNNWEVFFGGSVINKLGILFIVLGIIAVSQMPSLPAIVQSIIMFALGGGFLAWGEWMNRKKPSVFSLGLTSIGVAGLYAALSVSYFLLNAVGMLPAVILCVLITAGAFVLSHRYNSQTIAAFALVGGYIPLVSAGESAAFVYGCMAYFAVLNLLSLSFCFRKKWKAAMFIGFGLNFIGSLTLLGLSGRFDSIGIALLGFLTLSFAVYTAIPLVGNAMMKRRFGISDIVLLALNTFFAAVMLYSALYRLDLSVFYGVLAAAFALVYIVLSRVCDKVFPAQKSVSVLFLLTGLAFAVLIVPLQWGRAWVTLGWLAEGLFLTLYGILRGNKTFARAGAVIFALCVGAFVFVDVVFLSAEALFDYKYLAVTLGGLLILAALAYKKRLVRTGMQAYKLAALVNAWGFCLYVVANKMALSFPPNQAGVMFNGKALTPVAQIVITFIFALGLPQIKPLRDKGVRILSVVFSFIGMTQLLWLTAFQHVFIYDMHDGRFYNYPSTAIIVTTIFVALCLLSVLALRRALLYFAEEMHMPVEWLPFGISAYFLLHLTQTLVSQYSLEITSIAISIIYIAAALAWIVFGFVKRYAFMRRFGLGLSILAVAKLFLVDMYGLSQGYKMIGYFAFGAALLAISFVYQRFSKAASALPAVAMPAAEEEPVVEEDVQDEESSL